MSEGTFRQQLLLVPGEEHPPRPRAVLAAQAEQASRKAEERGVKRQEGGLVPPLFPFQPVLPKRFEMSRSTNSKNTDGCSKCKSHYLGY